MRAWTLVENGRPLECVECATPEPTGQQVVVETTHCGVCHSDLHIHDGVYHLGKGRTLKLADRGMKLPLVMGHEVVGRVVAVGPKAKGVKVGDLRLVFPWQGCGQCDRCMNGREHMCLTPLTLGVIRGGGYGSHVLVQRPDHLINIDGLNPAVAATYACSGVTVYSAIKKALPLPPKAPVVVMGAGGLGLNAIHILRAIGHEAVIAVDIDPAKREEAAKAGASKTLDGKDDNLAGRIIEAAGGSVEAVIDLVGSSETANAGLATLVKGGKLVLVGLFGGDITVDLPLIPLRAVSIMGSYVGSYQELTELVELAKAGKLKPLPVSLRPHSKPNEALEELRSGAVRGRLVLAA